MKLKNKKTGGIGELYYEPNKEYHFTVTPEDPADMMIFKTLAELNKEWEDYEEPETFWYMTAWGDVKEYSQDQFAVKQKIAIGNYFETKEEAEKAVEKLKAWKRLKDKGFKFELWDYDGYNDEVETGKILFRINKFSEEDKDLDLLFGGEE